MSTLYKRPFIWKTSLLIYKNNFTKKYYAPLILAPIFSCARPPFSRLSLEAAPWTIWLFTQSQSIQKWCQVLSHNIPVINFVLDYLLMLGSYFLGNYLTALITLWAQVTLIGKDAYFEGNWCYTHSGVKGQSKAEGQCWGSFITICLWHIKSYVLWTLPLLIIIHHTYRNIFEYETSKCPIKKYGIEFQPCIKVVSLFLNSSSIFVNWMTICINKN